MRGHEHLRHTTEATTRAAIEEFEAAVRLQPGYGQAWAGLGIAYHSLTDGGWHDEPIWYRKAAEALDRALELEPDNGQVRWLAAAQHVVHGRKREAYADLVAASHRAPHYWPIHFYAGYLFRLCDMLEESLLAWEHVIELEPNVSWPYWAMIKGLLLLRRHDDARLWSERLRRTDRGERESAWLALAGAGRWAEMLEQYESGHLALAAERSSEFFLALAYRIGGDTERSAAHMANFEPMASIDMDGAGYAAAYYAHAGDKDKAFRYLDRAVELGLDTLRYYENPNFFGPLHDHPLWRSFIAGVRGRVEEYRREFTWPLPAARPARSA
jgi:tetratricopeptide (TPR) repeat protein